MFNLVDQSASNTRLASICDLLSVVTVWLKYRAWLSCLHLSTRFLRFDAAKRSLGAIYCLKSWWAATMLGKCLIWMNKCTWRCIPMRVLLTLVNNSYCCQISRRERRRTAFYDFQWIMAFTSIYIELSNIPCHHLSTIASSRPSSGRLACAFNKLFSPSF